MSKNLKDMNINELKSYREILIAQNLMLGLLGIIIALFIAYKSGGGFLKYFLAVILGGFLIAFVPRFFYFIPKIKEIDTLILENSTQS